IWKQQSKDYGCGEESKRETHKFGEFIEAVHGRVGGMNQYTEDVELQRQLADLSKVMELGDHSGNDRNVTHSIQKDIIDNPQTDDLTELENIG
ncbi:unnamed protein product, partial [Ilex paraguariensis]